MFRRTQFGQTAQQRRELAMRFFQQGPAVLLQDWTRVTVNPSKREENGYRGNVTLTTPASGWFNGVSVTPWGGRSDRQGGILMVVRYRTTPISFYAAYLPISTQSYETPQYQGMGRVGWCASQIPSPLELGYGMRDEGIPPFHATYGYSGFSAPIPEMVGYTTGSLGNLVSPSAALDWQGTLQRIAPVRIDRYGYRSYPLFIPNQSDMPYLRGNMVAELLFGDYGPDFAEKILGTGRVLPGTITTETGLPPIPVFDTSGFAVEGVGFVPVREGVLLPPEEHDAPEGGAGVGVETEGSYRGAGAGAGIAVAAGLGLGAFWLLNR